MCAWLLSLMSILWALVRGWLCWISSVRRCASGLRHWSGAPGGRTITSAAGRVALFASLFRGREDVFATRWRSTRTPGRSGWAPKCSNEWEPGLCFKPTCAACAQRRFVPFSAAEVRSHLEGRQTAGIYPLLAHETCWLVAIDLDGQGWREDVRALGDTARELEMPVSVERSRSGLGALWVLFLAPVSFRTSSLDEHVEAL